MRVLVCGGRYYFEWTTIRDTLTGLHNEQPITTLIHGWAKGADSLGRMWAKLNNIPMLEYHALWALHGKKAGPIRNQQMIDEGKPDLVVAFPGGAGTKDMKTRARKAGIKVIEIDAQYFN